MDPFVAIAENGFTPGELGIAVEVQLTPASVEVYAAICESEQMSPALSTIESSAPAVID